MCCSHHEQAAYTSDWYPVRTYPIAFCQRSEAHWSTAQCLNLLVSEYHDPLAREASAIGEIVIQEVVIWVLMKRPPRNSDRPHGSLSRMASHITASSCAHQSAHRPTWILRRSIMFQPRSLAATPGTEESGLIQKTICRVGKQRLVGASLPLSVVLAKPWVLFRMPTKTCHFT